MNIVEVLWVHLKFLDKFEEQINSFTAKYISSPTMGYVVFIVLLILGVIFIRAFYNK